MMTTNYDIPQVQQAGFSLVELIVSLALFSVVITTSVGALLMLIGSNEQLQKEQSVMTNLSFALDSMTREIRTGVDYYCNSRPNENAGPPNTRMFLDGSSLSGLAGNTRDCYQGNTGGDRLHGVSFIESGGSITGGDTDTRIVYFFDANDQTIYRRIEGGDRQSIISSGIVIEDADFFVTGSAPLSDGSSEDDQASVTVFIVARDASDPSNKKYQIQTSVTQRTLDI